MLNLSPEQEQKLKDAVYMISDAKNKLAELNKEMIKNKQWNGQGDIEHLAQAVAELCENEIEEYTRVL